MKIVAQRHLRGDHLPRRDFRARFRARVPRATPPRALCLLRPARQQTAHNISGLLLIIHNISHRVRQLPAAPPSGPSSSARLPRAISRASATSSAERPLPPTTCAPADHLQHQRLAHLVIHNILHRVRHLPGGLKSPVAAPPLRGACRRLHASGTRNPHENSQPLWPADHRPRLCANKPTPLPCVTCSRVHRLLLLCV